MRRVVCVGLLLLWASTSPVIAQDNAIATDGLELWVSADGPMKTANNQITEWTDKSAKANNAIHDAFGQATPTLATVNGQPSLRFSGIYTGFHFTQITTIRTVFAVLSKDSTSCLPTLPNYGTSAKFWLGGNTDPTFFHPEHGCDIYNANLSEVSPNLVNGKTYVNGVSVDGRTTSFPFQLGLLSIVALANVTADTIARDRNFQDRSWQGNISELIIYSKALDDATRVSIENALMKKYAIGAGSGDGGAPDALVGGAGGANGSSGGSGGGAGTTGGGGTQATGGRGGNAGTGGIAAQGGATGLASTGGASVEGATSTARTGGSSAGGNTVGGSTPSSGGALSMGGTSAIPSTGGNSGGGGTTIAGAGDAAGTTLGRGGAPAGGAVGGSNPGGGVGKAGNANGCACAIGRHAERHPLRPLLFVLVGMAFASIRRVAPESPSAYPRAGERRSPPCSRTPGRDPCAYPDHPRRLGPTQTRPRPRP